MHGNALCNAASSSSSTTYRRGVSSTSGTFSSFVVIGVHLIRLDKIQVLPSRVLVLLAFRSIWRQQLVFQRNDHVLECKSLHDLKRSAGDNAFTITIHDLPGRYKTTYVNWFATFPCVLNWFIMLRRRIMQHFEGKVHLLYIHGACERRLLF